MAQCFELSLLPGANADDFEKLLWSEVFPKIQVLRRNVRGTTHKLLKVSGTASPSRYVWLVFVDLVGATPETAGEGPTTLAPDVRLTDDVGQLISPYATVAVFTEVTPPVSQAAV